VLFVRRKITLERERTSTAGDRACEGALRCVVPRVVSLQGALRFQRAVDVKGARRHRAVEAGGGGWLAGGRRLVVEWKAVGPGMEPEAIGRLEKLAADGATKRSVAPIEKKLGERRCDSSGNIRGI